MSKAADTLHDASEKMSETVSGVYAAALDKAGDAGRITARGVEGNPIAMLVGGIAAGAVAGALIPASRRESDALRPIGGKVNAAAREALDAARDAGKDALDDLGFSRDGARGQIDKLVEAVAKTASAAGGAAVQSFKS